MSKKSTVDVIRVEREETVFTVVGVSPLLYNAMPAKARFELLQPIKRSRAEMELTMKHDVLEEYRDSTYARRDDEDGDTRLLARSLWFKTAMVKAVPASGVSANMTDIKKLVGFDVDLISLWGLPKLMMRTVVRGGMSRSPDIATAAIVPQWVCELRINYATPKLNHTTVTNLLANAGVLSGVGDWRPERGGTYGQFTISGPDDPTTRKLVDKIKERGGIDVQDEALASPVPFDRETEQLLRYHEQTIAERPLKPRGRSRNNGNGEATRERMS